jgi:hypothetical protein
LRQQTTRSSNLALTATISTLTTANKTLADSVARGGGTATPGTPAGTSGRQAKSMTKPYRGNYCWTHGHRISKSHTSATCDNKGTGHRDDATTANTYGGSEKDKGWDSSRN